MVMNNTQRINANERCLGQLNDLEERVRDLTSAKEKFNLARLVDEVKELEGAIKPVVKRVSALEHKKEGITSSSSSPCRDRCIDALKALVNEL